MSSQFIKRSFGWGACVALVVGGIACSSDGTGGDPQVDPEETEQVSQDLSNPAGLVGRWRFNEGSGQLARDSSGFRNHGRLGSDPFGSDPNDPTWFALSAQAPHDLPPFALRFGAIAPSDFVKIPSWRDNFWKLEREHVSVEAWVRSTAPGTNAYVVAKGANACVSSSYALYNSSGGLRFYITDTNGAFHESPPIAAGSVFNGAWHHVVGEYDGAAVRIFFDGAPVGSTAFSGNIKYNLQSHDHLLIGAYQSSACTLGFRGLIDDVRIYDRALTPAEVAQRFTGLVTPDADHDDVIDGSDKCANTTTYPANNFGCSVAQCCPASNGNFAARPAGACPKSTGVTNWDNHGQYVSCVSNAASQLLNEGKISYDQRDALTSAAGRSDIGK